MFLPEHIDAGYVRRACAGGRCRPHPAPPLSECTQFAVQGLPGGRLRFERRALGAPRPIGEFFLQSTPWRVPTSWLWRRPAWRGPVWRGPAYAGLGALPPPPGVEMGVPPWRSLDGPPPSAPQFGRPKGHVGGSYDWWWWNFGRPARLPYNPPRGLGALDGTELPDRLTPLTADQATSALATAYQRVTARPPTQNVLGLLVAQTAQETAEWQKLHNYGFGNLKASASDPYYQGFRCWEVVNGQTVWYESDNPICRFAAYLTPEDGAEAYIRLLAKRPNWWNGLHTETVDGFISGLTTRPVFFTGDPAEYARRMEQFLAEYADLVAQYAGQAVQYAGQHKYAAVGTVVGVFTLTFGSWYLFNAIQKKRKARAA